VEDNTLQNKFVKLFVKGFISNDRV